MNISAAGSLSGSFTSANSGSIDKQIEMLNKRKAALFQKMNDVLNGEDGVKDKEEKIKIIKIEINMIDLQIQQLIQKKIEMEKRGKSTAAGGTDQLPPSPSEMMHPEKEKKDSIFINIQI